MDNGVFSHMAGRTTKNSLKAMADESTQISTSHSGDGVVPHIDEISETSPGNTASDTLNTYVEPSMVIDSMFEHAEGSLAVLQHVVAQ